MNKKENLDSGRIIHNLNGDIVRVSSIMELINDIELSEIDAEVVKDFESSLKSIANNWESLKMCLNEEKRK